MPELHPTTLALLGITSGTYLGCKVPEKAQENSHFMTTHTFSLVAPTKEGVERVKTSNARTGLAKGCAHRSRHANQ